MDKKDLMENFTFEEVVGMVTELRARVSQLEDRHQSDCITIVQLQTTIDVLASKYAKLREQVGL